MTAVTKGVSADGDYSVAELAGSKELVADWPFPLRVVPAELGR